MKEAEFRKHYPNLPKEVLERGKAVRLIFFGIPMFVVTSIMLYKRAVLGEQKKVQIGEFMSDGSMRPFSKKEIEQRDKNTIFTMLFGEDKVNYNSQEVKK